MFPQLANRIVVKLRESIAARGKASLVLSGGSSPLPLFERLSQTDLEWDKVDITLADERWVEPDDEASNERMIRTILLKGKAAKGNFIPLKTPFPTPEEGAEACQGNLEAMTRPFDVVLLGMGNDGHTASLFPGGDRLSEALDPPEGRLCMPMNAPGAPQPRITLTLPALLQCRDLVLLCTGQGKQDTFKTARGNGPVEEMPIRAVLRQKKQGIAFYWAP